MQKVYLSKTQSGIYGLFTDGMLVTSLGESLYNTLLNNKNVFIDVCQSQGFEAQGYTCKYCGSAISIDSKVKLCYECYTSIYPKLENKIYFTVKADTGTYYYESDCKNSLAYDIDDIEDDFNYVLSITFSNQLPKGILL